MKNQTKKNHYNAPKQKTAGKETAKPAAPVYKSYMYLAEKPCKVSELAAVLDHVPADRIEVWTEVNLLELTTDSSTVTFEDMMDDLRKEDKALLEQLQVSQVYAFEYEQSDSAFVRKVMESFLENFGGRIGSDTEDFEPFCDVKSI